MAPYFEMIRAAILCKLTIRLSGYNYSFFSTSLVLRTNLTNKHDSYAKTIFYVNLVSFVLERGKYGPPKWVEHL